MEGFDATKFKDCRYSFHVLRTAGEISTKKVKDETRTTNAPCNFVCKKPSPTTALEAITVRRHVTIARTGGFQRTTRSH